MLEKQTLVIWLRYLSEPQYHRSVSFEGSRGIQKRVQIKHQLKNRKKRR